MLWLFSRSSIKPVQTYTTTKSLQKTFVCSVFFASIIFFSEITTGHPLSTEPKTWNHDKAAMSSLLRQKLAKLGKATPLFYNNLPTQWALSLDESTGGAGWWCWGGWRVGAAGENRARGWQCCSECVIVCVFGVEQEGTGEGQSKGLCVRHFECILSYTVHGSPRVQTEQVIYFVDIMNVGFVFMSGRTRMFSLVSPHRGRAARFYFGHMETMGLINL